MFQLLHQFLIQYSQVHFPGIGTLVFTEVPAKLDLADKQLMAPQRIIGLNTDEHTDTHQVLMGFLSKQLHISEEEAYSVFNQFSTSIKNGLDSKNIMHWDHLGIFQKDESGTVQFVQSADIEQYLLPVAAERIIRHHAEHTMMVGDTETTNTAMQEYYDEPEAVKKDYWWVWAIVIFMVSAGLIWLKHFR